MVFNNNGKPYRTNECSKFQKIVTSINKMVVETQKLRKLCIFHEVREEYIARVFAECDENQYEAELIVRPVQILAAFDNQSQIIVQLKKKYKILFDFYEQLIKTKLIKANLKILNWKRIKRLNHVLDELSKLNKSELEVKNYDDLELNGHHTIISSNVPMISLSNIYQQLRRHQGAQFEMKNLFLTQQILQNEKTFSSVREILNEEFALSLNSFDGDDTKRKSASIDDDNLRIIINCTSVCLPNELQYFLFTDISVKFFFIIPISHAEDLKEFVSQGNYSPMVHEISYKFSDLTSRGQNFLLRKRVNFQNNYNVLLNEIVEISNANKVIDEELLQLLSANVTAPVNSNKNLEENVKKFYSARSFLRTTYREIERELTDDEFQMQSVAMKLTNIPKLLTQHKVVEEITEVCDSVQFEEVSNEKFVIISDIAGTGKSWVLLKRVKQLASTYRDRWTLFVTLQNFADDFIPINEYLSFDNFILKTVLKSHKNYEKKIFKELYKSGKVFILFDAFNELLPHCAEFVSNLIKSFDHNGGNQMWITTRPSSHIDLKKICCCRTTYALNPLDLEECAHTIARRWSVNDEYYGFSEVMLIISGKKLADAKKLSNHFKRTLSSSIGSPQISKIIAAIFSPDQEFLNLQALSIFPLYKRFAEIKIKENIWGDVLGVEKVHQFFAMKCFFPSANIICDLKCEDTLSEKIIECGILNETDGKITFSHQTFAEYYAAGFIERFIKQQIWIKYKTFFQFFVEFLSRREFKVIRSFLNDALADVFSKSNDNLKKFATSILEVLSETRNYFYNIITENLENLFELLCKLFNYATPEMSKMIFYQTFAISDDGAKKLPILTICGYFAPNLFEDLLDFLVEKSSPLDFENLLIENRILETLMYDSVNAKSVKLLLVKMKECLDKPARKRVFMATHQNLIGILCTLNNFDTEEFNIIWDALVRDLEDDIFVYLLKNDSFNSSILHYLATSKSENVLQIVFKKLEIFLKPSQLGLLMKKTKGNTGRNFLHETTFNSNFEFKSLLWTDLLKNYDILELVSSKENDNNNYLHSLILRQHESMDIIKMVFETLENRLTANEYKNLLKIKNFKGQNLLQNMAKVSQCVASHKELWDIIKKSSEVKNKSMLYRFNSSSNDQTTLLKFAATLYEVDDDNNNILNIVALFNTKAVFEFMINYFESYDLVKEIPSLLTCKDKINRNILQCALTENKSLELHEYLWQICRIYLHPVEVDGLINNRSVEGNNILDLACKFNTKEIVIFTWNEIEKHLETEKKRTQYLAEWGRNLYVISSENSNDGVTDWICEFLTENGTHF